MLAAHRGNIKTVLIPADNERDLADIPDNIKSDLNILPVRWIDEVLEHALQYQPTPTVVDAESIPETESSGEETDQSGEEKPINTH